MMNENVSQLVLTVRFFPNIPSIQIGDNLSEQGWGKMLNTKTEQLNNPPQNKSIKQKH